MISRAEALSAALEGCTASAEFHCRRMRSCLGVHKQERMRQAHRGQQLVQACQDDPEPLVPALQSWHHCSWVLQPEQSPASHPKQQLYPSPLTRGCPGAVMLGDSARSPPPPHPSPIPSEDGAAGRGRNGSMQQRGAGQGVRASCLRACPCAGSPQLCVRPLQRSLARSELHTAAPRLPGLPLGTNLHLFEICIKIHEPHSLARAPSTG